MQALGSLSDKLEAGARQRIASIGQRVRDSATRLTSRDAWSDCASDRGTARGGKQPLQSSREAAIAEKSAAKRAAIAQAKADKQAAAKAKAEADAVPAPT